MIHLTGWLWTRLGFWPELAAIPRPMRRAVLRHWQRSHAFERGTWVGMALAIVVFVLLVMLAATYLLIVVSKSVRGLPVFVEDVGTLFGRVPIQWALVAGLAWVVGMVMCVRETDRIMRRSFRRFLRDAWSHGRAPICYVCGYDLRGTPGPTCSECGAGIPMLEDCLHGSED